MATLIFFMDFEEGHLFPSFGLARSLKERGHVIHYVGLADIGKSVLEQGFEFHPVLVNDFPVGFRAEFKKKHLNTIHYTKYTLLDCVEKEFALLLNKIKPQGCIVSTFLSLEAVMLHYVYAIKPIILIPAITSFPIKECRIELDSLGDRKHQVFEYIKRYHPKLKRNKHSFVNKLLGKRKKIVDENEFQQYISPIEQFEHLLSIPEEFELPGTQRSKVHYINPCIRKRTEHKNDLIEELKTKNKKIVFVVLGTQTTRIYDVCEAFYWKIYELMKDPEMMDFHVVLSTGSTGKFPGKTKMPPNLTVVEWIDSLDILELSSAIITHGGLGLVKESIYFGVPMIILPDKYDQPANAERIEYLKLGVRDDLVHVTPERLKSLLIKITTDPDIKRSTEDMKSIFRRKEDMQIGAKLVESIFNLDQNTV